MWRLPDASGQLEAAGGISDDASHAATSVNLYSGTNDHTLPALWHDHGLPVILS
jgi:hypothetical protein